MRHTAMFATSPELGVFGGKRHGPDGYEYQELPGIRLRTQPRANMDICEFRIVHTVRKTTHSSHIMTLHSCSAENPNKARMA